MKLLLKKFVQLTILVMLIILATPYLLGKINFYGNAIATTGLEDLRKASKTTVAATTGSSTTATTTKIAETKAAVTPATTTNATSVPATIAPPNTSPTASSVTSPAIQTTTLTAPISYADAVALAGPAVVSIKTTQEVPIEMNPLYQDPFFRYFFGDPNALGGGNDYSAKPGQKGNKSTAPKETLQGLGSGVLVSDKGYILTNYHVIKEADKIIVTLADGRTADGKLVGSDADSDLSVIQIKLDKLPVITIGQSQSLRPGDVVLAIGNPFGLDKTVTHGIVSATERAGTDIGILENLIQTDAAINPGNSGGALIDPFGRLVGINTAIYSQSGGSQGIGFAIPIDQATTVMDALISGKKIVRGYFGIMMKALSTEIRESTGYKEGDGVYVQAIVQGGPGQKAGILPGDVITKINGVAIKDVRVGLKTVAALTPSKNYPIEIYRKGEHLTFSIIAGERKQSEATSKPKEQNTPQ